MVGAQGRAARSAAYVGSTAALAPIAAVKRQAAASTDFMSLPPVPYSTQSYVVQFLSTLTGLYAPGLQAFVVSSRRFFAEMWMRPPLKSIGRKNLLRSW